ncbi:MAG: tetratricopeptide repeat protein [Planctomycetota bacterium]|jgi:tetratricopeptide (TPR) repeat protein
MSGDHNKLYVGLVCLVLVLATFVAYEPVRRNGFINYDDDKYVTENPHVQAGLTRRSVVWAFTTSHMGSWHPLTWLSHMLDCELFGLNPFWHHLTSLAFHTVNSLMLFWLLRRMTGAVWPSAFIAAAFALHPLHVESVAWVAERKDVLSAFFWLLTIWAYLRYVEHRRIARYMPIVVFFSVGLMAKPMLVTLPFVLLLLDYWPLGRLQIGQLGAAKGNGRAGTVGMRKAVVGLVVEKIPLFFLTGISCVVTFLTQQAAGAVNPMGLIARTGLAVISYGSYIWKIVWPSKLAVFYPLPNSVEKVLLVGCAIFLTGVTAASVYWSRRRAWLLVGWLWYLGTLVPVIGLVQVGAQAMADRYTYLPSIGIFIMAAWGVAELLGRWRYVRGVLGVSAVVVLLASVVCTRFQVGYWRNNITLYEHALAVTERNYRAHNNLGGAFHKQGMINEAVKHYRAAVELDAGLAHHHWNLGNALVKQGWIDEAITQYRRAVELEQDRLMGHKRFAEFLFNQKRFNEAAAHFARVVELGPDSAEAHNNLGAVLVEQGKLEAAVLEFRKALELRRDYFACVNLAAVLLRQGKVDESMRHYREALKINPKGREARDGLNAVMAEGEKLGSRENEFN